MFRQRFQIFKLVLKFKKNDFPFIFPYILFTLCAETRGWQISVCTQRFSTHSLCVHPGSATQRENFCVRPDFHTQRFILCINRSKLINLCVHPANKYLCPPRDFLSISVWPAKNLCVRMATGVGFWLCINGA